MPASGATMAEPTPRSMVSRLIYSVTAYLAIQAGLFLGELFRSARGW